jgi:ferric-dicitrate binding protein FerR (iron transport regulator)
MTKRIELEQRGIHTSTLAEKHANLRRRRATRFTIIAGLITGWVIAWMRPQWFPVPTFYTHADAPLYEQLSERLPEETLVALAPGSHIAYARWLSGMREHALYLDGEATFLIAANSRHSVVVAGPGVEVRANGGRFTIQAYESVSHAHVSVQEGHVQVRARTLYGYGELLTLRAGNAVLVGPGLQIMPDEFSIPPWRFGVKWP